eukprot:9106807-Karenia_brevis.AAC.1
MMMMMMMMMTMMMIIIMLLLIMMMTMMIHPTGRGFWWFSQAELCESIQECASCHPPQVGFFSRTPL